MLRQKLSILGASGVCLLLLHLFKSTEGSCSLGQTCVTDITEADCDPWEVLSPTGSIDGCCPGCVIPAGPDPPDESICKPPSSCLPNGKFGPVQCKGDVFTGRCFCSDENGKRIFGQMWRDEATEMTCACSRRRSELEAAGRATVTLHCSPNGDYEALQCDEGICWCADPKTGQPIFTPVHMDDMTKLPCYSSAQIGENYLRQCESVIYASAVIGKEQSDHGTNFLGHQQIFCEYDGSYGPYVITYGSAFCSGKDGEILGSWQTSTSDMAGMNCNCARDSAIYFPERGLTHTEVCMGNGNYRPNQNVGDVYYCVDTDGYHTGLLDAWPADQCASYA